MVPNRRISRKGPELWPPRSPASTPKDFPFFGAIVHWENSKPGPFNTKKCCCCFFSHARYSSTHLGWRSLLAWCVQSYQSCISKHTKRYQEKNFIKFYLKPHKNTFLPVVAIYVWLFGMCSALLDDPVFSDWPILYTITDTTCILSCAHGTILLKIDVRQ